MGLLQLESKWLRMMYYAGIFLGKNISMISHSTSRFFGVIWFKEVQWMNARLKKTQVGQGECIFNYSVSDDDRTPLSFPFPWPIISQHAEHVPRKILLKKKNSQAFCISQGDQWVTTHIGSNCAHPSSAHSLLTLPYHMTCFLLYRDPCLT